MYGDIYDAYQSIMSVVNYFGDDSGNFSGVAGPGNFNDGDMVSFVIAFVLAPYFQVPFALFLVRV